MSDMRVVEFILWAAVFFVLGAFISGMVLRPHIEHARQSVPVRNSEWFYDSQRYATDCLDRLHEVLDHSPPLCICNHD